MATKIEQHYFTFGYAQARPDLGITDPMHQYVTVRAPEGTDHRALLMAWLGGNNFAFEYEDSEEYDLAFWALVKRHNMREAARITVVQAPVVAPTQ